MTEKSRGPIYRARGQIYRARSTSPQTGVNPDDLVETGDGVKQQGEPPDDLVETGDGVKQQGEPGACPPTEENAQEGPGEADIQAFIDIAQQLEH